MQCHDNKGMASRLDIATVLALIVVISSIALTDQSEISWISHSLAGLAGMTLMVLAIALGAMLAQRIKRRRGNVPKLHKKTSIYFSSFILGAFFYELWMRLQHNEPLLQSVHGRLGLIIVLIIIFQLIPRLTIKGRAKLRGPHRILGYSLAPLIILDASLGLYSGVIIGTKSLVLIHSISGGLAVLALAWVIVEILYLTEKGVIRAKVASYLAALFIIAGCWVAGGYNYLTVYGAQVKPIILAGPEPWAHRILMESKEHIFIFLPIIALSLCMTLSAINKDVLLKDWKSRRAITTIASLALFMVLLMFLLGAFISNAGKISAKGLT
jgi:hypothetical protein